jgi:hypothetical protein
MALVLTAPIISSVKSTISHGYLAGICGAVLVYAAAAFAQGSSNGLLSGGNLMAVNDSAAINQQSDCKARFAAMVRDLDAVLASDPKAIDPIYELFKRHFPIEKCSIEDALATARASRFFVGSEEAPEYYNIGFNSAGVSSGYGFGVLISLNKKTGIFELPFAKVNGF